MLDNHIDEFITKLINEQTYELGTLTNPKNEKEKKDDILKKIAVINSVIKLLYKLKTKKESK